jgi:hypothetical protein
MTAQVRSLKSEVSRALLTSYFGLSLFIAPAAALGQTAAAQDIRVKIVSPEEDGIVSGPTMLRAQVAPPGAAVTVTFYVDGRQVCRAAMAPFECEFDVGQAIAQHQVRAVAMGAGVRVVDTVVTKSLGFAETVDVEIVQVTVSVNDGKGSMCVDCRERLHGLEDGQPQTIRISVGGHSARPRATGRQLQHERGDAEGKGGGQGIPSPRYAARSGVGAGTQHFSPDETTYPQQRLKAVERLAPWGATALYDVIIAGADMLGRAPGRKAMLVFSDGEDQGSHASLADAERRLEASDMTLYMIGQGRGTKMESLKRVMNRLSAASGGRALVTEKPEELRGAFADLLQELSNQYLLAYTSTNIRRDGTLRRLRVEVEGYRQIRARDAYRAPSPK